MRLIDQDSRLYRGVFIHDLAHIVRARIEDANTRYLAPIANRANNREHSLRTEREISASMLPDDACGSLIMPVRAALQDDEGIISGGGQHLAHVVISDCGHEWFPPDAVFFLSLQARKCEAAACAQSLASASPCQ